VGPKAGVEVCEKSRPHRDSIPDHPARSQSLYRLSYPGPLAIRKNRIILLPYCIFTKYDDDDDDNDDHDDDGDDDDDDVDDDDVSTLPSHTGQQQIKPSFKFKEHINFVGFPRPHHSVRIV
jgi:hypothetical protein